MSIVIVLIIATAVALTIFLAWYLLNRSKTKAPVVLAPSTEQLDAEAREFRQSIRDEVVYQIAMGNLISRAAGTIYEPFATLIVAKGEELLYERNKEKRLSIIAERDKLYSTLQESLTKAPAMTAKQ